FKWEGDPGNNDAELGVLQAMVGCLGRSGLKIKLQSQNTTSGKAYVLFLLSCCLSKVSPPR
ncbi:hypothetical protein CEXT_303851, partial [Caerostris extrusa]